MVDTLQKEDCCGCKACANVCPQDCITFETDKEGFWYPVVDKDVCVECGMCESVCPSYGTHEAAVTKEFDVFGAWCNDENVKFCSSSGGLFSVFADVIIEQGGIVFGVTVNDEGEVVHSYTDKKEGVCRFRKSKYVQSNTGFVYRDVKKYLDEGRPVLFSGTPCQVLALHKFLGKKYDQLYTIDVVCVGVPSPGVWRSYLAQLERENGGKAVDAIFRYKEMDGVILKKGQRNLTMHVTFDNGKTLYQFCDKNMFFKGFLDKLFQRPSCSHCKAKGFASGSDIQLGDFWEIENIYPEVLTVKEDGIRIPFGISEVLVYTEKGKELFQRAKKSISYFKADRKKVEKAQADTNWYLLTSSCTQQHWNRDKFFKEYDECPQMVYELIRNNLNIRNLEYLSGKKIGMWGGYNLRNSIGIISDNIDCELMFQFRNSTIYSLMSETDPHIRYIKGSANPFRNQMIENDIGKEFRVNIENYAKKVDCFIMDLMEERYDNLIAGKTVVTKSEGYFESTGIQGMPITVSFDMWKSAFGEFMQLIKKHFSARNIIIAENYLSSQYGKLDASKYIYKEEDRINCMNAMLREKYDFIRENWPEITMLPKIRRDLCFTDKNHRYGCLPEHLNYSACCYLAQEIGAAIGARNGGGI